MFEGGVFRGSRVRVWRPATARPLPVCKIIIPAGTVTSASRAALTGRAANGGSRGWVWQGEPARTPVLLRAGDRDVDAPARRAWRSAQGLPPREPDPGHDPAALIDGRPAVFAADPGSGDPFVVGDALFTLHAWRTRIGGLPPGPALVAALADRPDELIDPPPRRGHPEPPFPADHSVAAATLDEITARARQIAALHADQARALTRLADTYPADPACLPLELAQALHLDEAAAHALLDRADHLVHHLPATLNAWGEGTIGDHAVDAIANATATTTPAVAAAVETDVLPKAAHRTYDQTYRAACRRVHRLDAAGVKQRAARAALTRRITRRNLGDDTARLTITATAAAVATIWEAITGLADAAHTPDDRRDLGQRRVDALTDLCADILRNGGYRTTRLPLRHGHHPQVRVTMPLTALLGDNTPCDLDGHGPITADHARSIAADADLLRLIHDPIDGRLLDLGRSRYRPPKNLRDHVVTRDHTCTVPGCRQPAMRCDLDHAVEAHPDPVTGRPTAGTTNPDNLGPFCRFHHNLKTRGLLHIQRHLDGTVDITTPLRRTTTREPHTFDHPEDREHEDTAPPGWTRPAGTGPPGASHPDDPAPF